MKPKLSKIPFKITNNKHESTQTINKPNLAFEFFQSNQFYDKIFNHEHSDSNKQAWQCRDERKQNPTFCKKWQKTSSGTRPIWQCARGVLDRAVLDEHCFWITRFRLWHRLWLKEFRRWHCIFPTTHVRFPKWIQNTRRTRFQVKNCSNQGKYWWIDNKTEHIRSKQFRSKQIWKF